MLHIVDGKWHQIEVQYNLLSFGQKLFSKDIQFKKNEGPLTTLLNELGASIMKHLDSVEGTQVVLHLPVKT